MFEAHSDRIRQVGSETHGLTADDHKFRINEHREVGESFADFHASSPEKGDGIRVSLFRCALKFSSISDLTPSLGERRFGKPIAPSHSIKSLARIAAEPDLTSRVA